MKLITKEIQNQIPSLYETEESSGHRVYAKYFHPFSNWTWYACEFDADQGLFFGLVKGQDMEMGYFTLAELESINIAGLPIERDLHWDNEVTIEEIKLVS
jgi:hypothetical protein